MFVFKNIFIVRQWFDKFLSATWICKLIVCQCVFLVFKRQNAYVKYKCIVFIICMDFEMTVPPYLLSDANQCLRITSSCIWHFIYFISALSNYYAQVNKFFHQNSRMTKYIYLKCEFSNLCNILKIFLKVNAATLCYFSIIT